MFEAYAEYGAIGVIVSLFIMMIMNLIKSQKMQNEDLDQIRQSIAKIETKVANSESIIIKLISRWDRSDSENRNERDRRHESLMKEVDDLSDSLQFIRGRLNGKVAQHEKKLTTLWSYGVAFVFVASVCINLVMRSF